MIDGKRTILVVDDNPATLYSTARVLEAAGFEVLQAETGTQGLEMAAQTPDLIVLDVNLPDMSGFEVCRRLRQDPATALIPIVHLSATFVKDIDRVHGLKLGADGYLTHPVEPPVLVATINAFLRAREAEQGRQQVEQNFKAIFDNAPNGIVLLDESTRFLEVNPALCKLLGRSRSELIGMPCAALLPTTADRAADAMMAALKSEDAWSGLLPLLSSAGAPVYLEWSISRYSTPGVWLGITMDMTEKRAIEAEREQLLVSERAARSELERASRLKDEFLATLSHELRTPLSVIVGWAEVLCRSKVNSDELAQGLETIARNAKVQQQLISDLLDVSRIINGKLRLETERVDLVALTASALDVLMPAVQAKEIRLKRVLNPDAGIVLGDPSRLKQVIWNLVNNAVKFTPKGGWVQVVVERADSSVQLTVADSGQGIKPEFLPFIFERFRQQDAVLSRSHGGLGLGLAIVKHLAELHGGSVHANSKGEGQGAEFVVRLPLISISGLGEHPAAVLSQHSGVPRLSKSSLEGISVLVVDDDADGRLLVKRLLSEAGADVRDSSSANHALEQLDAVQPDVLVCDIGMPDRDGYSFIRAVRSQGYSHRDLPAIALTAFARTEDRQRAMLAGYQLHLSKPVESTELLAAIITLVGRTLQD